MPRSTRLIMSLTLATIVALVASGFVMWFGGPFDDPWIWIVFVLAAAYWYFALGGEE